MRTGVAKALKSRALGSSSPIYAQSVHFMKTKYLFSGKWQKVLKWDENTTPYWKIWQVVLTRVARFWEGWCWKMNFLCSKLSLHGKSAFPLNCCHHTTDTSDFWQNKKLSFLAVTMKCKLFCWSTLRVIHPMWMLNTKFSSSLACQTPSPQHQSQDIPVSHSLKEHCNDGPIY